MFSPRVTQRVTPALYRCFPKPQRVTRVTLKVLKTNLIFIFEKLVLHVVIYKIISIKLVLDQVHSVMRSVTRCITHCCITYCNFVICSSKKECRI